MREMAAFNKDRDLNPVPVVYGDTISTWEADMVGIITSLSSYVILIYFVIIIIIIIIIIIDVWMCG